MAERTQEQQKAAHSTGLVLATIIALRSERSIGLFAAGIMSGIMIACDIAAANGLNLDKIYRAAVDELIDTDEKFKETLTAGLPRALTLLSKLFAGAPRMKKISHELDGPGFESQEIDALVRILEQITGAN